MLSNDMRRQNARYPPICTAAATFTTDGGAQTNLN